MSVPLNQYWLFSSIAGLASLLKKGYIVAATDYQGLGGPGPHPYLVGPSAAHSVLDLVRAAREVPQVSASTRFAVWGERRREAMRVFGLLNAPRATPLNYS